MLKGLVLSDWAGKSGSFRGLNEKWCARRDSNSRSASGGFPPQADSIQLRAQPIAVA